MPSFFAQTAYLNSYVWSLSLLAAITLIAQAQVVPRQSPSLKWRQDCCDGIKAWHTVTKTSNHYLYLLSFQCCFFVYEDFMSFVLLFIEAPCDFVATKKCYTLYFNLLKGHPSVFASFYSIKPTITWQLFACCHPQQWQEDIKHANRPVWSLTKESCYLWKLTNLCKCIPAYTGFFFDHF